MGTSETKTWIGVMAGAAAALIVGISNAAGVDLGAEAAASLVVLITGLAQRFIPADFMAR